LAATSASYLALAFSGLASVAFLSLPDENGSAVVVMTVLPSRTYATDCWPFPLPRFLNSFTRSGAAFLPLAFAFAFAWAFALAMARHGILRAMPTPTPPWSIRYSDGAANSYSIDGDGDGARLVYRPIRPEESSTGTYSGGDPRSGRLDAAQVATLWQRVAALEGNRAIHQEDRNKGTGMFNVKDATGERGFIIQMGADIRAFDDYLRELP
jgi:hypothetical protein